MKIHSSLWLLWSFLLPLSTIAQELATRTGVIIDGQSGRPLPGTVISAAGVQTIADSQGRFSLPAGLTQVRFSHVGYTEVTAALQQETPNRADTIRLLRQTVALPTVTISSNKKPHWIATTGQATAKYRFSLVPGSSCAILFKTEEGAYLRSLSLGLVEKAPKEGRLRISLVGASPLGGPDAASLLASPIILNNNQLSRKDVSVKLDSINIVSPGNIFVVVEGLTSQENEFFIAQQNVALNKDTTLIKNSVLTYIYNNQANGFANRATFPGNYPMLGGMLLKENESSNAWLKTKQGWTSFDALTKLSADFKAYNFNISLEVY